MIMVAKTLGKMPWKTIILFTLVTKFQFIAPINTIIKRE